MKCIFHFTDQIMFLMNFDLNENVFNEFQILILKKKKHIILLLLELYIGQQNIVKSHWSNLTVSYCSKRKFNCNTILCVISLRV